MQALSCSEVTLQLSLVAPSVEAKPLPLTGKG